MEGDVLRRNVRVVWAPADVVIPTKCGVFPRHEPALCLLIKKWLNSGIIDGLKPAV